MVSGIFRVSTALGINFLMISIMLRNHPLPLVFKPLNYRFVYASLKMVLIYFVAIVLLFLSFFFVLYSFTLVFFLNWACKMIIYFIGLFKE